MSYVLCPTTYTVVQPSNVEHYLQVNPTCFAVKKVRGGWKPVDPKRWLGGKAPIQATLAK